MSSLDLEHIERELKKRHAYPYQWLRKQNDEWDGYTNFIYQISNWDDLIQKIALVSQLRNLDKHEIFQYASNRWYNFWSAKAVEQIFTEKRGIESVNNTKDSEKDFYLFDIPFDHKTSVFPKQFGKSFEYAQAHKIELIEWLYKNQSSQKRYHLKNRLFIVVYDKNGEHWKLKAEISILKKSIFNYLENYNRDRLCPLTFFDGSRALSDIIWVRK